MGQREGRASFKGFETWYRVVGDVAAADLAGPAPLVVLHGGPGDTHEYLLPLADLARGGRAVVFYDQLGNGKSTHLPSRGADFWTVQLFQEELENLIGELGIGSRYHLLGQSWGGFLAQEHALTHPKGLRSLVLSNTACSFPDFSSGAELLRQALPPQVEATLRRHELAGTTEDPEYAAACEVFYHRYVCRLDQWPEEVVASFAAIESDPTVYHTMNGPSEFHVTGSIRDWEANSRIDAIDRPTLVISGRHDEAVPELQQTLVELIPRAEQRIMEESSHMPFWEERDLYLSYLGDFLRRWD